jgi:PilZ domain
MFFRRKPKQEAPPAQPEEQRRLYRAAVDPEMIRATVTRGDEEPLLVGVTDLSLEGAGIEIPFHLDPEFEAGDLVDLALSHMHDGWSVTTSAQVEQTHPKIGANVPYGLTFLGTGSLYAQMEDTLGRYFNRRRHERVRPDLDKDVEVRLRQGGHRPRGPMHDLSSSGMCVAIDLVAAVSLKTGAQVEIRFELPGCKGEFEGRANLVARRRLGPKEFVSLEFDLQAGGSLAERHGDLVGYVARRSEQIAAFSRALAENTTRGGQAA